MRCYKDQEPLGAAHGYSSDGRVKILAGIEIGPQGESWANPPGTNTPDQRLAAAAARGMYMWDRAIDNNGQHVPFYFDTITGTQPITSLDIVIVKRPLVNPEGD